MSNFTEAQRKALERKSKTGWAFYYSMKDNRDNLAEFVDSLRQRNTELRKKLNDVDLEMNTLDITYLKNQFIEMYDKLKEYTECPVCFETITKHNGKLANCGHLHCVTCYEKLDNCSICRKKFYK